MKGREIEKRERQNKVKNGRERREKRGGGRGKMTRKRGVEMGSAKGGGGSAVLPGSPVSATRELRGQARSPGVAARPASSASSLRPPGEGVSKGSSALCSAHLTPALKRQAGRRGEEPGILPSCLCSSIPLLCSCVCFLPHLSPGRHLPLRVAALGSTLLSKKSGFCLARHCRPFTTHA